jgi:TetR/AcrR family transcriptional repressor of mexJK operon
MTEQFFLSRSGSVQTGRPTRETARRRQEELLERALELFSHGGFELTTIDAIASSLNMTKRTIYARYKDKAALFEAAVNRAIDRWFIPIETLRAADAGDLEATLVAMARLRVANNLSREGQRLQRVVSSEALRFPEICRKYEAVTNEVTHFVAEVFEKYRAAQPGDWFDDLELAAAAFLSQINTPVRAALLFGRTTSAEAVDEFIRKTVRLFLTGMLPRG